MTPLPRLPSPMNNHRPSPEPSSPVPQRTALAVAAALALATFLAFAPALWNDFVSWDDETNFLKNDGFRGLGLAQLRWMFTTVLMGHWIPVTWLTLGLDYTLWGMNPLGYHLTNNLLHAVNVVLLYGLCLRLFATAPFGETLRHVGAATAALLFGLHPLRAESVAWITERRDLLSMAFFLASVLLYLRAHGEPLSRRRLLAVSLASFALGVASKSMIMSLPAVLLILDVYPLRRIDFTREGGRATRAVLLEKVPFAVLGLVGAGLGYYGQQANRLFDSIEHLSVTGRASIVGFSYWFYVWKSILPLELGPLYEMPPRASLAGAQYAAVWLGLAAITAAAVMLRKRCPALLAAWVYYVVTLLPVSGIAHTGPQIAGDRYSYLPCLGFAVAAGAGLSMLLSSAIRPALVRLSVAAVAVFVLGLGALTMHQVAIWRDTPTLWLYAVESAPECSICHANLGVWLGNHGNLAAGIQHSERALALRPDNTRTHVSAGVLMMNAGRLDEAVRHFEKRLAAAPTDVEALVGLGVTRLRQDRTAEARQALVRALSQMPDHLIARYTYATALGLAGLRDQALTEHRRTLAMAPNSASARFAYGYTLAQFGELEAARVQLEALGRLEPSFAAKLALEIARKL